jgi:cytoplasmic iron level regulating protein YaaA (DUF328/UPF0246 family)
MKVILSPAKSINDQVDFIDIEYSQPIFQEESAQLIKKLSKLSQRQIKKLMSVSDQIAELNYNRFQSWSLPFTKENSKPAAYIFTGAAYQFLDYTSLSKEDQLKGQSKLRVLSGLYGLLKPLDLIQSYRLEMGTKFAVTPKNKNLYLFWGDKLRDTLQAELDLEKNPILVNAASNEYSKALQLNKLNAKVITTVFKDIAKDGSYKVNMMFAKQARGAMARFVIQNNFENEEGLKTFESNGYYYSPNDSSDTEYVFLRDKQ